ncbi:MAG: hypothetical protein ACPGRZ_05340 [Alphaproteobacteria bacterium]
MPDGSMTAADHPENLLDRLPPRILGGLTAEQKAAIASASGAWKEGSHRVNIRVTLPVPGNHWYFTVLGGPERRAPARRKSERSRNPIRTAWNIGFIFLAAFLCYGTAVGLLVFSSSVLAF